MFLVAALLSILLIGYHYGTFDQAIHIPFLKANANPLLYPGDEFIALRHTQFSYFWQFFQPFYRLGILEETMFAVHFLATYLTFWALWSLSMTLFGDPLVSCLTLATFIFPHIGFLGFPVIEFSLLNRTFVLPFLLFAINFYLHQRYEFAFLLLGLMINLHILSAGMVAGMLLFAGLVEARRIDYRRLCVGAGAFMLGALPLLLLGRSYTQPIDWSLRPEWLSIVARGSLGQVYYPFAPVPFILLTTIGGLCVLGLFYIAQRAHPPIQHDRTICLMQAAALLIFVLGLAVSYFLPITFLAELQLNRASFFILIFSLLYFANYLVKESKLQYWDRGGFFLLSGVFIVSATPIIPLSTWMLLRKLKPRHLSMSCVAGLILGSLGLCVFIARLWDLWQPGIHLYAARTDWVDVQRWASVNTSLDATFITPPEKGGPFEPEWRVFSERSNLASLVDLMEIALAPQYLETWLERYHLVAPGAVEKFNSDYFENRQLSNQAFYSLADQVFFQAVCEYGADYLVVEKPHTRGFPVIYENQSYVVYRLAYTEACETSWMPP